MPALVRHSVYAWIALILHRVPVLRRKDTRWGFQ